MNINPGRIMNNFIEQNKRQYAIPVYQRNYEWSKDQCVKLFDDIIIAAKRGKEHFCGSVVYSLIKNENNINYYIVIDGQQRLTTVYLLLKALETQGKNEVEKSTIRNVLINTDPFNQYPIDIASKLKLKPIKSDNNQLILLIDNKFDEVDQNSDIWNNYKIFCELIEKEQEKGITVQQIYYGIQCLSCVDIQLGVDDNAQEIFERINSTGVPLSLADKIRNFVLMVDVNQEYLFEEYWLPIEKSVNKDNMTSFFLNYLNMKVEGFPKENDAYDRFKQLFEDEKYTNESMLKELKHYAELYALFTRSVGKDYDDETKGYLSELKHLKQTTLYPFLFRVFDDYKLYFDKDELNKILKLLLNYSVRRIVCEVGSNSLRGLYKTLYTRIFINEDNKKNYYDSIASFLLQITSKDVIPSDEDFINALKYNNLYRKSVVCKYLLDKIENKGKESVITKNLSIEHIIPQNKNTSTSWQKMLGDNWIEVKDKYLHTLGNLTLTGYNSELSDSDYAVKKKEFFDTSDTKIKTLNVEIINNDIWNESVIVARAERLSNIINEIINIEQPSTKIEFIDPRYKLYSCNNVDEATNKTPNYFVFNGEKITCSTWSDMLKIVINRLYEYDSLVIKTMAMENDTLYDASYPFFSYDSTVMPNFEMIQDSKIYHRVGFSAATIIFIIKKLMDRYEMDYHDFEYSARDYKNN